MHLIEIIKSHWAAIGRVLALALGVALMITGVVISPLPGPMGLPLVLLGLVIALKASIWAKRRFIHLTLKYPKWLMPLRQMLRPKAKVVMIFYRILRKAERMIWRLFKIKRGFSPIRYGRRVFRPTRPSPQPA